MYQERLIMKGQLQEAKEKLKYLELEAGGIVRSLRNEINPLVHVRELNTAAACQMMKRLNEINIDVAELDSQIKFLDEALNG